ncbi:MAG: hypothetical protein ACJ8J0_17610 [Longimicrobiaceae bacterium]
MNEGLFSERPVQRLGPVEEEALLERLSAERPRTVLVVSDLHLSYGRDPATARYPRTENFLADDAFARWLDACAPDAAGALLVLNGDTFDFLRICTVPGTERELAGWAQGLARLGVTPAPTAAQLRGAIDRKERRFGLGTEDFKSVWKLWQIAAGHGPFFDALGRWVARGGRVLLVKGNHDVELYWPLVRLAVREILAARAGGAGSAELVAGAVAFADTHLRIANLHLEHGHQYEPPTRVLGGPVLDDHPSQLRLPLGSFVNRYLINPAEQVEPFLDNVRPVQRYIVMLLRRHPLQALGMLERAWPFIVRSLKTPAKLDAFGITLFLVSLLLPLAVLAAAAVLGVQVLLGRRELASLFAGWKPWLGALGMLAPYLLSAGRELLASLRKPRVAEDDFADHAYAALRELPAPRARVLYAVYGHTHDQDTQALPPIQGTPVLYLNTGTWTPLFIEDRPDLLGRAFRPFLRFTRGEAGEYTHEYLEWSDDRGAPVAATILGPDPRSQRTHPAPAGAGEEDAQGVTTGVGV